MNRTVLLTMTLNGEPFRRQLSLQAALSRVVSALRCQQVSHVTIKSGRVAV